MINKWLIENEWEEYEKDYWHFLSHSIKYSQIKKLNIKVKEVEVKVNPIDANNVIGHKKENVKKLKEYYDVDLVLKQDENIKQGKSKIEVTKTFKDFAYEEK